MPKPEPPSIESVSEGLNLLGTKLTLILSSPQYEKFEAELQVIRDFKEGLVGLPELEKAILSISDKQSPPSES